MAAESAPTSLPRLGGGYDGESPRSLADRLGLSSIHLYASVGSTMDVGHALAMAGAAAGTLILADEQTAGRGRQGSAWRSAPGQGIWMTLVERPEDASAIDVLSLRVGLAAARALDPFADAIVQVKWPNDLFVARRKLAGVLVEARWRGAASPDWVAIGVGVNVRPPRDVAGAAALREHTSRLDVLASLVPAVRDAAAARGVLTARELGEYAARDYARGHRCLAPARGVVVGVTADGALTVRNGDRLAHYRAGSLVLEEGA